MENKITKFGSTPDVEFDNKTKQEIEQQDNMSIIKGTGTVLSGWVDRECDCKFCTEEYEDINEYFCSKKEAEEYANLHGVNEPVYKEDIIFYIKAVAQLSVDFGLFKEVV